MAALSDVKLIEFILDEKIVLRPFVLEHIQPSSIDLTLDPLIKIPKDSGNINLTEDIAHLFSEQSINSTYILEPGKMVLGQISETIGIPRSCNGQIHNRSSLARLGLDVSSASYVNPGYSGKLPIIIKNFGNFGIDLVPGIRICQIVISTVEPEPRRDYSQRKDSKYFDEADKLVSLIHKDVELIEYKEISNTNHEYNDLASFLQHRIKEKSKNIVNSMSDTIKKELGLK